MSVANFVSIALFGDGAAAVVLRNTRLSPSLGVKPASRLSGSIVPNTQHITGWDIKENSFGVVLSPELPSLIRSLLRSALDGFLARNHLELRDLTGVLLNPGGRRVLETAQNVLGLSKCDLRHSWDVLREYGNMASATALFILERGLGTARGTAFACCLWSWFFRVFHCHRFVILRCRSCSKLNSLQRGARPPQYDQILEAALPKRPP